MYDNIGGKIKKLATFLSLIGIIISILIGLILTVVIDNILFLLLIGGLGSLFAWIASFCLYGFGQLIENSDKTVRLLWQIKNSNGATTNSNENTATKTPNTFYGRKIY